MQPWSSAMAEALYGPSGFYRRQVPGNHFRTSVSSTPLFAVALSRLVMHVDDALGNPEPFDLVDVGAGDSALLTGIRQHLPTALRDRVRAVAVELRDHPAALDHIHWTSELPSDLNGLVMAHELLDNVPCDVIARESGRLHVVLVNAQGEESIGPEVDKQSRAWLNAWWPLVEDGDRAEFGEQRDKRWANVVGSLNRGLALAVDYGHRREDRLSGSYNAGTLTGYRDGRHVLPVPDGTCDITAHVAVDACAAAGLAAGAEHTRLIRQRGALQALGVSSAIPDRDLASLDPPEYVRQLSTASSAAELMDPVALGSFWWLFQSKGMAIPVGSEALSG
jgi:SAM-dependent MidA family methyltransferase